jgi:Ca2+-binding EF-hand superfamily protein
MLNIPGARNAVSLQTRKAACELFQHMDTDGDGTISVAELQELLRELGEEQPEMQAHRLASAIASGPGQENEITFEDFWSFQEAAWGPTGGAKVKLTRQDQIRSAAYF